MRQEGHSLKSAVRSTSWSVSLLSFNHETNAFALGTSGKLRLSIANIALRIDAIPKPLRMSPSCPATVPNKMGVLRVDVLRAQSRPDSSA